MSIVQNILQFIPQRPPFVMIETLVSCDNDGASSTFTVKADNIFIEDNILKEPALVENIAQTCAARIGYICHQENKPVPIGFIGAVQGLKINRLPKTGDVLKTFITIKNQIFNATIVEGVIKTDKELLAQCEMRIFIANS